MVEGSWISPALGNVGSLADGRFVAGSIDGIGSIFVDVLKASDNSFIGGSVLLLEGNNLINLGSFNPALGSAEAKVQIRFIRDSGLKGPEILSAEFGFMKNIAQSINLSSDIQLASLDRVKLSIEGSNFENIVFEATSNGGIDFFCVLNERETILPVGSIGSDVRYRITDFTPRFGTIFFGSPAFSGSEPQIDTSSIRMKSDDWIRGD